MAGISRATAQLFGTTGLTPASGFAGAANSDLSTEIGSSNTVANIQSGISGEWAAGWLAATLGSSKFPAIEDLNAVDLVFSTQIAYLLERGIPEYDAGTTYNIGDICRAVGLSTIYKSLINANTGNALSNGTDWQFCGDLANIAGAISEQTITGANHALAAADTTFFTKRSNGGVAMVDTAPGTSGALANGEFGYYQNVDATASLTIGVGSGGTLNQGLLTGNVIILPGELWLWQSQGTGVYNWQRISSAVLHAAPVQGASRGLKGKWVSNTTANFTANEIVLEDTNGNTRKINAFNQTVNSAVSGAGGVTSALAANIWYGIWAIFNPTTGVESVIMDVSFAAPTLPAGYTFAALISFVFSDASSHLFGFQQVKDYWQFMVGSNQTVAQIIGSGVAGNPSAGTYAAASIVGFVPAGILNLKIFVGINNAGSTGDVMAAPNASYGGFNSTTNPPQLAFQNSSQAGLVSDDMVLPDGATAVQWASSSTGAYIGIFGFHLNT